MGRIICGFPGVGKTFYYEQNLETISDSDSNAFSWSSPGKRDPNFPGNYIEHIISVAEKKEVVLVSSHDIVRNELEVRKIPFTVVYPLMSLKNEYLERFLKRESPKAFLTLLDNQWESFVKSTANQKGCDFIVLKSGQYLSDVI